MDFLSFSNDYWDSPRSNRQYFCEALARHHRVLFCGPPFYVVKLLRGFGRGTLNASGVRRVAPNLVSYSPSKLLFSNFRFPAVEGWMAGRRHAAIRKLMRDEGFGRPVLLLWNPEMLPLAGVFDELLLVYYAYDQYSGYTGGTGNPDPREIELLRRADVVFAVSEELRRDKARWAREVHHLPNAVDFGLFSLSRAGETEVPADMRVIERPRLGYVGTINEKLNVPLLEILAYSRPSWSIVLIGRENYTVGPERERFLALTRRPNVHWLGYRPHDSLPAYLKGLDVCMMCYVINDWTYYGDPLKMHEYLASGKPTIAAGLRSILPFSDVIAIPASNDEWVSAVEQALERDTEAARASRVETARRNSYETRVADATAILEDALSRKGRGLARG